MLSSPKNNNFKRENRDEVFRAIFKKGAMYYCISNNSTGFYSWPGRYSQPAVDLDKYLKDASLGRTNDRIGFASWANSEEEFIFYLNLFFNIKFYSVEEYEQKVSK